MDQADESVRAPAGAGGATLRRYLESTPPGEVDSAAAAFYGTLDEIATVAPNVAASIVRELQDQRTHLKLIASENYCSMAVQLAQGTLFTDKYAEGVPGRRFYAGCENVDDVEREAAALACELFGAEHAYLQPHSGADANLIAFTAILATRVETPAKERLGIGNVVTASHDEWQAIRAELHNQRLLAMDYFSGGHLTHGYRHNISSRLFDAYSYTVDRDTGRLDLDAVRRVAREARPLILLGGYSAYSRLIDFAAMREIADEVGAVFMVDMAHFAGLVAGEVFSGNHNPVPFAHVISTTTHKTLRGPRGGMVLATAEFAEAVDKGCPAVMGGPLPHVIAAKAVALTEARTPEFRTYAGRIVENARSLADELQKRGLNVLTGGTDNHLVLIDVAATHGLTGRQAEAALRDCGLTMNRNAVPFDENGPWYTSGLRMGTAAVTTLGMGPDELTECAALIADVLAHVRPARASDGQDAASRSGYELDTGVAESARSRVGDLLDRYPLYPNIDLSLTNVTASPAAGM